MKSTRQDPNASKAANDKMEQGLRRCIEILRSKRADYGMDNFGNSAIIASIIRGKDFDRTDAAAILLGIKLTRYGELTASGKEPVNESLRDTVDDAINYVALMERERQRDGKEAGNSKEDTSIS